ncbi:MAG: dihydroorotate dehydrogenase, partial [Frankia sp.]|nr:dihydroorotate dehydrogenase [Frankia sp.]
HRGQPGGVCAAVAEGLAAAAAAMPGQAGTDAAAAAPGAAGPGATRRVPYGVKISPFSDPEALAGLADVLAKQGGAPGGGGPRYVVAVNTFPNALAYDTDGRRPAIDVELAGMAGPALRPIALGQVRQLRRLLPAEIDIVGAGGITTGRDVADFLRSGASAVQLATAYFNRDADPAVFGEIAADWAEHWLDA